MPEEPSRRTLCIEGLRQLAEYLETHPEVPLSRGFHISEFIVEKEDFIAAAKAMGSFKKEYTDYSMSLVKEFGPIIYSIYSSRGTVCTSKVVGTKLVPAQPSYYSAEVPEHEEEIVEWECSPLFNSGEAKETPLS